MGGEVRTREQRQPRNCVCRWRRLIYKPPGPVRGEAQEPTQFRAEAKPWRHEDLLSARGYGLIKRALSNGRFRRLRDDRAIISRRYAKKVERRGAKVEH
jgi:hypothetical protein